MGVVLLAALASPKGGAVSNLDLVKGIAEVVEYLNPKE